MFYILQQYTAWSLPPLSFRCSYDHLRQQSGERDSCPAHPTAVLHRSRASAALQSRLLGFAARSPAELSASDRSQAGARNDSPSPPGVGFPAHLVGERFLLLFQDPQPGFQLLGVELPLGARPRQLRLFLPGQPELLQEVFGPLIQQPPGEKGPAREEQRREKGGFLTPTSAPQTEQRRPG